MDIHQRRLANFRPIGKRAAVQAALIMAAYLSVSGANAAESKFKVCDAALVERSSKTITNSKVESHSKSTGCAYLIRNRIGGTLY